MRIHAFTSDTHYGHAAVLGFCSRPFADVDAMNEALIANYNAVVPEGAVVVWAGDAFLRTSVEDAAAILARLNGMKLLVRGNHDGTFSKCTRMGFSIVTDELQLRMGGRQVRVSHFPYAGSPYHDGTPDHRFLSRRPERRKGEALLHGHTHRPERQRDNMIHVGVDAWDYRPALWDEVEALVASI